MPCVGTPSGWSSMSLVTPARSQFRFTSEKNADRSPVFSAEACWESRQISNDVVGVKGSLNRKATLNRALPAVPPLPGWVAVAAPDTGCRYWLLAASHSPDAEATLRVDRQRLRCCGVTERDGAGHQRRVDHGVVREPDEQPGRGQLHPELNEVGR